MKKISSFLFLVFFSLTVFPTTVSARNPEEIYDWYIKDFETEITVNKDSSLTIEEKIIADCGYLPDKHGIFRILPTVYYTEDDKKIKTPIELLSITDFNGEPYTYSVIKDGSNNTVTWKIGDPDITVTGENEYEIKYTVKNTIRFDSPDFDEFYWNLNGNFWDLETDHFLARITFPEGIDQSTVMEINNYSGLYGEKDVGLSTYEWIDADTLQFESTRPLAVQEGITASVTFPKNIISQPVLTFWEQYEDILIWVLYLSIPFLTFLFCFLTWLKYGRDVGPGRAVAPEFDIPDDMNPMAMGTFMCMGKLKTSAISASIIQLAVNGYIKIEELPKEGLFSSGDTKLILVGKNESKLAVEEKKLLKDLFEGQNEKLVSDLKDKFYTKVPMIQETIFGALKSQQLFETKGFSLQTTMSCLAMTFMGVLFFLASQIQDQAFYLAVVPSIAILFVFSIFMPKTSPKGAELLWRIKGFKMYMQTAEKYRQQYNEKENIFEKFLPYAMLFDMTELWVSKMKEIYGESYFNHHRPLWYAGSVAGFNADQFSGRLNAISQNMATTMASSPSGSGGRGGSGGGGGGGGGGGW